MCALFLFALASLQLSKCIDCCYFGFSMTWSSSSSLIQEIFCFVNLCKLAGFGKPTSLGTMPSTQNAQVPSGSVRTIPNTQDAQVL